MMLQKREDSLDFYFSTPQTSARIETPRVIDATRSNFLYLVEEVEKSPQDALLNFRFLSGLNWSHIAELLGTSRRTLHYWASGKEMTREHEKHVLALDAFIKFIKEVDRGSAKKNREAILEHQDGKIFSLLQSQKYDDAIREMGIGAGRLEPLISKLAKEERDRRKPLSLETLAHSTDEWELDSLGKGRGIKIGGGTKGEGS